MSLLRDSLQLISSQPGTLIYYLVTLFAIQLILGVAADHWQRRRDDASTRLLATGAGVFLGRTILMLAAILARIGLASPDVVLPPLERFLHFTTVVLTIWAFLPILQQATQPSTAGLIGSLAVAALVYAAFAVLWPGIEAASAAYNSHWQASVWEVSTVVVLGVGLAASLTWREGQWGWLACLLGVWLMGHALQLAIPIVDADSPGWVRLADLAALPLLASLVLRQALTSTSVPADEERESEDSTLGAVGLLRAVRRIDDEGHVESTLEVAAASIARTLGADVAAIGLSVPGPVDVVRVVALHPPTGVMLANQQPTLIVSRHPLLATALESQHLERAVGERQVSRVATLYRRLGFEKPGPMLVQPLTAGEDLLGVILAGNPSSQREWRFSDEQLLQAVAGALASAISGAQEQEDQVRPNVEEMREKARRMAERAKQLETELERQRQQTEKLTTKLRLREKEATEEAKAVTALSFWKGEIGQLAEARDTLQAQLAQWQQRARKLTEAKAELEEQLKTMSQAIGQSKNGAFGGILVGDEQGRVILASQAIRRLLGRPREKLINTPLEALFDESLWKKTVRRLLDEGEPPGSVTVVSLDLENRIAQAELSRLPENERWPGRIAAAFYRAEGSTAQNEMIASLIEELRTPMTSITGYTDLLIDEKVGILGESQRQFLLRIEANIARMEALLNDLIKATDVDAGKIELVPEPIDLAKLIDDAIDACSARLDEKELDVRADVSPSLAPVYADRDSIRQIVLNLISNAALASKPGTELGVQARVEEQPDELKGQPGYVLVSVTDTGGGIAPEYYRHVFQRFYRAKNPLIEGMGETGVGLSVAKALVEANGGRIWVESEMEVGSTFSFILPLSPQKEPDDLEAIPKAPEAQG